MSNTQPARRGRPPATTHEHVIQVARALFHERGYTNTSLDLIAETVGISRTALFSYFRSKADLIWGEYDAADARMAEAVQSDWRDLSLPDAIEAIMRRVLDFSDEEHAGIAQRWEIIEQAPELTGEATARVEAQRTLMAEFIARRCGLDPTDFLPSVVSRAVYAASLAGSRYWARQGQVDTHMVDTAMQAIRPVLNGFAEQLTAHDQQARGH